MNQKIFIERKPQKKKLRLRKGVILFVLVFVIVLSAIFLLYFFSEKNRVKSVKVLGNEILSDDYIIENCGINKQDYLLFVNGFTVNKIDLIDNIKVTKNNGVVYLEVKEKKLVGYNDDNDKYTLFDLNGKLIPIDKKIMKSNYLLPYICINDSNLLASVCSKLAQLSNDNLFRIAEIYNISFTYDSNMLKLVMDQGYYVYCSVRGIPYLTNYLDIISTDQNQNQKCILILEEYSKAIKTDCSLIGDYLSSTPQ